MNVAMWGKALAVIPRISKEEWEQLDVVSRWLVAARGDGLVITFIPVLISGLLAFRAERFDFGLLFVLGHVLDVLLQRFAL